ncbi:MAG: nucleotidyltransferase domain-containing protein [Candidatus Micrarchaeota archaeon]|nr:nucleotidyltransferase domain-containing protein [Candidatus Micrarchaeota archaeon]
MLSPEFKLLNAFLFNPSKALYAREIERLTNTNHERAGVYLDKLARIQKTLIREDRGKQAFYHLNKNSELTRKALAFAEMERRIKFVQTNKIGSMIRNIIYEVVKDYKPHIYFIALFGSVARSHQTEESDIDLVFVLLDNGKTRKKIAEILKKQEIITGKKISFHPITFGELERGWFKEPVYNNIWDERIIFFGEENFWNFVIRKGEP